MIKIFSIKFLQKHYFLASKAKCILQKMYIALVSILPSENFFFGKNYLPIRQVKRVGLIKNDKRF